MAGGGIGEQSWRQVAPLQLTHPSKEDLHVRSRRSSGRGASLPVTISTGSTALTTLSTFTPGDVGQAISGAGIPAGASVVAVPSTATATLSVPADATGSVVADVGVDPAAAGWLGWVPTTAAEAASYSVAAAAAGTGPHDRMTDATTGAPQRTRASYSPTPWHAGEHMTIVRVARGWVVYDGEYRAASGELVAVAPGGG